MSQYGRAEFLCTGDKPTKIKVSSDLDLPRISDDFKRIAVRTCHYYTPSKAGSYWYRDSPDFANIGGYETTYYFTPTSLIETARERLFMVSVTPRPDHFTTIVGALTEKFKEPKVISEKMRTGIGIEVSTEVVTWTNLATSIVVRRYAASLNQSSVTYVHNALMATVDALLESLKKENARKI